MTDRAAAPTMRDFLLHLALPGIKQRTEQRNDGEVVEHEEKQVHPSHPEFPGDGNEMPGKEGGVRMGHVPLDSIASRENDNRSV